MGTWAGFENCDSLSRYCLDVTTEAELMSQVLNFGENSGILEFSGN